MTIIKFLEKLFVKLKHVSNEIAVLKYLNAHIIKRTFIPFSCFYQIMKRHCCVGQKIHHSQIMFYGYITLEMLLLHLSTLCGSVIHWFLPNMVRIHVTTTKPKLCSQSVISNICV